MSVFADLAADATAFDVYAALRLIECEHPDKPRLGASLSPSDDAVRFGQEPSLAFAPSALAALEPGARNGGPPRLVVRFFGLLGPNGPLPHHITEYIRDRLRNSGDRAPAWFLDIFHNRLVALFYRAWADAQPAVDFDRAGADRFAVYVGALFGLGQPSLRDRDTFPDLGRLHHAGRLAPRARNEEGLEALLENYFDVPCRVEPFTGQWLTIPAADRWLLGESEETGSLGLNTTLGARLWECQQKFRVVVGPLSRGAFDRFLPGRPSLTRMRDLIRSYVGEELAWDLRLVLAGQDVPPLSLGGDGRLGLTMWLTPGPLARDAGDLVLDPGRDAA